MADQELIDLNKRRLQAASGAAILYSSLGIAKAEFGKAAECIEDPAAWSETNNGGDREAIAGSMRSIMEILDSALDDLKFCLIDHAEMCQKIAKDNELEGA